MWATLSIVAMWLAVLFAGVFGPNFLSNNAGVNATIIPSLVFDLHRDQHAAGPSRSA